MFADIMDFDELEENDLKELWGGEYAEAFRVASELDFSSLLDPGHINSSSTESATKGVVLNDRLIGEASLGVISQFEEGLLQGNSTPVPPIKSEHSYSLSGDPPKQIDDDLSDMENECYPAIPITEAEGSRTLQPDINESSHNSLPLTNPFSKYDRASSDTISCCDESELAEDFVLEDCKSDSTPSFHIQKGLSCGTCGSNSVPATSNCSLTNFCYSPPSYIPLLKKSMENSENDKSKIPQNAEWKGKIQITSKRLNTSSSMSNSVIKNSNELITKNSDAPFSFSDKKLNTATMLCPLRQFSPSTDTPRCFSFPPTPPSCSGSDCESISQSPPSSPLPLYEVLPQFCSPRKCKTTTRMPINTPLISSQPKGATGSLNLTEEEKKTLLSEGYPIPNKLPLTKAEEKSLKKIRRKIKNKISAQESRRKKKEYMDTLESKVEVLEQENTSYKRRIEVLQNKNLSLMEELKQLQNSIANEEKKKGISLEKTISLS